MSVYLFVSKKVVAEACDLGKEAEINVGKLSDREIRQIKETFYIQEAPKGDLAVGKIRLMEQVLNDFPAARWLPVTNWDSRIVTYYLAFRQAS